MASEATVGVKFNKNPKMISEFVFAGFQKESENFVGEKGFQRWSVKIV